MRERGERASVKTDEGWTQGIKCGKEAASPISNTLDCCDLPSAAEQYSIGSDLLPSLTPVEEVVWMVLPIVTPAPVVVSHGDACRDLFDNQCEFRHFQNYLTGLMVMF